MGIARKCSYCGNLGHNARTCKSLSHGQPKLFGDQLGGYYSSSLPSYSATKISLSPNNLFSSHVSSSFSLPPLLPANHNSDSYFQHTKKGVPWTEEEHRIFLVGLEKLGKGNWRDISRNFVTTRTPTQVASHAQKYFLRQSNNTFNRTKHSSTLFHWLSHPHSALNWPTTSTDCTLQSASLDLELKLATPKPLELVDAYSAGLSKLTTSV
ncbi:transcription factor MYBS3 [Cajanus cajan]|uniref:Myb-like protein J n=1 Tax=Cajanus cajan TaxID=3821 RepID=A0A151TTF6_CAJCA|nr:transcription factor MYBS3 [Cajanus cajan]KYP70340.1 Myb-like protein J [Cajanus cajan]